MHEQNQIEDLQLQLTNLRGEFAYYLRQRAVYGVTSLPFDATKKIKELREQIQLVKQKLRDLGVLINDDEQT